MLPRKVDARANMSDPVTVDIDLTDLTSESEAPRNRPDHGWLESSYELRHGLEVHELPMDRLPGELLESFARSKR